MHEINQRMAEGKDGHGVYVVINEGGDRDKDITHCNALFSEWDDQPKK